MAIKQKQQSTVGDRIISGDLRRATRKQTRLARQSARVDHAVQIQLAAANAQKRQERWTPCWNRDGLGREYFESGRGDLRCSGEIVRHVTSYSAAVRVYTEQDGFRRNVVLLVSRTGPLFFYQELRRWCAEILDDVMNGKLPKSIRTSLNEE